MLNRSWVSWVVRAAWLSLPLTAGTLVADALAGRSGAVTAVTAALMWAGWSVTVFALLVPRPLGLVAVRVGATAALATTLWAAADTGDGIGWVAPVAATLAVTLLPETGAWMVNGGAYGDERRHLLRPPVALLAGPVALAALALPVAVAAGPLLLAARAWVPGTVASMVGVPAAVGLARALHALTVRWVVMVPVGLVVKDHLALLDPVLLRRTDLVSIGPAPADSDAVDLTAGAPGLAIELRLREPVTMARPSGRRRLATESTTALLVTPTRPGAVLADAADHRLPVG